MKREYSNHGAAFTGGAGGSNGGDESSHKNSSGKGKMWEETENDCGGGGVDELMAVLGYQVKSSDMTEVAQKLEQLEKAMGNVEQDGISQLASDTAHYNPSDLSSWLESMLSEFNPTQNSSTYPLQNSSSSAMVFDDSSFESDLTAIPGNAVYPPPPSPPPPPPPPQTSVTTTGAMVPQPSNKRLKPSSSTMNSTWVLPIESVDSSVTQHGNELTRPLVLVDSQENGVRLVHTLMACAEAVQQENLKVAEALVKQIGFLAISQAGAMRKVATYFAEAIARRIYKLYPTNQNDSSFTDYLEMHFYETCPYHKFAHFTANQAILEAFVGKSEVHVIDFGIKQGMQWPALLQALACRPGGPPKFRLTGIGPPPNDNSDNLQEVGWKLAQLAQSMEVKFEYRGFVTTSLADLDASLFNIQQGETLAINSVFDMHSLLAKEGDFEKLMSVVRELKPKILTVVEQEANHNGPVFMDRFTESLHYYSTLFDSLESSNNGGEIIVGDGVETVNDQNKVMSEVYLGRQICNVVACEGTDRVERHETLTQWRTRFGSAGFEPVHLGSVAFKQASMLLAVFAGGDGYRVEENNGCLLLGWHTRPLIATSAWKLR